MSEPLSLTGKRWSLLPSDEVQVGDLARRTQLPPLAARVLLHRTAAPEAWLAPSLGHLHDPHLMLGMDRAVARVQKAVADKQRVRIVTDYDVDGTTSSLILQAVLQLLLGPAHAGLVDYHIPHRFDEGYGFSVRAAESAAEDGVKLILTADIGVRDHAAVTAAAAAGVDVIICDHHLPAGESVPFDALAVLCPPQDGCPYPNKALAACGVSLKIASALLIAHPKKDAILRSLMKLAAIGTVADVVDLSTLENRAIVSLGLEALRGGGHSPGLMALLDAAGVPPGQLSAEDLGYRLGPRINAAGRLDSATAVVDLLNERDPARARAAAAAIEKMNHDRQGIQGRLLDAALAGVPSPPPAFITVWGDEASGWHRGVVGIVAAKVRDRLHRPTAVIAVAGDEARGSVRSVPGVHAVAALDSVSALLMKYGGHPVAAGFSVRSDKIAALAEGLAAWTAEHAGDAAMVPVLEVDAAVRADELSRDAIDALLRLGPHGKGNPAPLLRLDLTESARISRLGSKHLRVQTGGLDAVWWNGAEHENQLHGPVSLVGTPGLNTWQGRTSVRLTVQDARPAAPRTASQSPR